jgi:hypothetical protein
MFAGVWDAASGKVVVLDKPPFSRAASDAPSTTGEKGRALQNLKDTLGWFIKLDRSDPLRAEADAMCHEFLGAGYFQERPGRKRVRI